MITDEDKRKVFEKHFPMPVYSKEPLPKMKELIEEGHSMSRMTNIGARVQLGNMNPYFYYDMCNRYQKWKSEIRKLLNSISIDKLEKYAHLFTQGDLVPLTPYIVEIANYPDLEGDKWMDHINSEVNKKDGQLREILMIVGEYDDKEIHSITVVYVGTEVVGYYINEQIGTLFGTKSWKNGPTYLLLTIAKAVGKRIAVTSNIAQQVKYLNSNKNNPVKKKGYTGPMLQVSNGYVRSRVVLKSITKKAYENSLVDS